MKGRYVKEGSAREKERNEGNCIRNTYRCSLQNNFSQNTYKINKSSELQLLTTLVLGVAKKQLVYLERLTMEKGQHSNETSTVNTDEFVVH